MKEARIQCLCQSFPIHDLGLSLHKGNVAWVSEEKARASKELAEARRIGAVRVDYVERYRMKSPPRRMPPPPFIRQSRPGAKPAVRTNAPDMEEVGRRAEEAATKAVQKGMDEIKEMLKVSRDVSVPQEKLEEALRNVLAEGPAEVALAPPPETLHLPASEPVYIPTDVVDTMSKGKIEVEAQATAAGDMDEAAAELKKRRKTRKKKTKKKKE
jgi:hypothetical protein